MAKIEECLKIGDKYYLNTDVQKVLEVRITSIIPEDLPGEESVVE